MQGSQGSPDFQTSLDAPGSALSGCFDSLKQLGHHKIADLPSRVEPKTVLMCGPDYFEVKDVKNPHMAEHVGTTDRQAAILEWEKLRHTFEGLGYPVNVVPAQPGLEDMVYAANQVFVGTDADGTRLCIPANMKHSARQKEVPFYVDWFRAHGYKVQELTDNSATEAPCFEGHGDALWHPSRRLIWGAYGFRTAAAAYDHLSVLMDAPILRLRLVDAVFYHLDTCLAPLDEETAMYYPAAFDADGRELLGAVFKNLLEVNASEAANFACNAAVLGRNVVMQKGSPEIRKRLQDLDFEVCEVDTSEFIKGGGSVFCLKTMVYSTG